MFIHGPIKSRDLIILSFCHLLVDGVSAAVILHQSGQLYEAILIYNTFAFTTQCLTGMIPDKYGRGRLLVLISSVIMLGGAIAPLPAIMKAVVIGLGNSLFHVSGGYMTLKGSRSMGPLGVFVAPGALGLFIGTAFPELCMPMVLLLVILAAALLLLGRADPAVTPDSDITPGSAVTSDLSVTPAEEAQRSAVTPMEDAPLSGGERGLLTGLLLVAIAARAVGGSAVVFPWKTGLAAGAVTVFAVFLGKSMGGFIAERSGIRMAAVISVTVAALMIVLASGFMIPSLVGQFALNISMPITLFLIYRLFPDRPGLAFGLAASALWPGTLIGKLIHLTGIWSDLLIILCFAAGLAAILVTEGRLENEKH